MKSLSYNRGYREPEDSFFDDIYRSNNDFWTKCSTEEDKPDPANQIFSGRLFHKNAKQKKWISYHYELYPDCLVRINLTDLEDSAPEQLMINSCFLKKIKYSDASFTNYKYGIRLQKGENKCEMFTENQENFNKWYDNIKRFCLLPKFQKKYKILTKIKALNFLTNSSYFYKCYRYSDSNQYCARIIDKFNLSDQARNAILKEISILRRIDHPNILKLMEVYEDESNIFLIFELFQGKDLRTRLNEYQIFEEKQISDIIWKLLSCLSHLEQRGVFHRDIRPENIYFRSQTNPTDVVLSNFFQADFFQKQIPAKAAFKKIGSPGFIAPEIFTQKQYNCKVDIFSLGIVFYSFVYGKSPFEARDSEEMLRLNEKCIIDYSPNGQIIKLSSSGLDLLKKMLAKDPQDRCSSLAVINHTWFINMRSRAEDVKGKPSYQLPTLSTIQEKSECELSSRYSKESRLFKERRSTFSNTSSWSDSEEFENQTLSQKMNELNQFQFCKVPSKTRHDTKRNSY